MCLMPAIIIYRNYYHGRLMTERRTGGMAWAAISRVIGIMRPHGFILLAQSHQRRLCANFCLSPEAHFARRLSSR